MSGVGHAADKAGLKKYEIPATNDPNLKLEIVYQGNYTPGLRELNQFTPVTQFAFLGNNDILMLSKNDGKVLRVLNHKLISEPLLDVNVTNQWESGLLGIAISKDADKVYVFLYYTESKSGNGTNTSSTDPTYNKLYRYELINNKLRNPKLLLHPHQIVILTLEAGYKLVLTIICTLQLATCMETKTRVQRRWPRTSTMV